MLITCTGDVPTITQEKLTFGVSGAGEIGQYVDGSYWVVAPFGSPATFSAPVPEVGTEGDTFEGVLCTYIGRAMIDPGSGNITKQGWDNRVNSPPSERGPGITYQADQGVDYPVSISAYSDGKPKTLWGYRGRNSVVDGSESSGCYTRPQITIVSAAPAAGSIKPPGIYCAGGKPERNISDIDVSWFTPVAIPVGATEPNWDVTVLNYYRKYPLSRFGETTNFAFVDPNGTMDTYPAYQARNDGAMALAAISNSASAATLRQRFVRDGLEVKALIELGTSNAFVANGGLGVCGKLPWKLAQLFLGETWDEPDDVNYAGNDQRFFMEDEAAWLGDVVSGWPLGKPLFGARGQGYLTHVYPDNHITRDINGERDSHWMIHHIGTVASATTNTIGFSTTALAAAITAGLPNVSEGYPVFITSGTGIDQLRYIAPLGWNNTTKVATITPNWTTIPSAGSSGYEYGNGGEYQHNNMSGQVLAAMVMVILEEVANWDHDPFFDHCKRWINDNGLLTPRTPPSYGTSDYAKYTYIFDDGNQVWGKLFYDAYAASIWPSQATTTNLITNPGFTDTAYWVEGTDWALSGGEAVKSAGSAFTTIEAAQSTSSIITVTGGSTLTAKVDVTGITNNTGNIVLRFIQENGSSIGTQHQDSVALSSITVPQTLSTGPVTIAANCTQIGWLVLATDAAAAFKIANARLEV